MENNQLNSPYAMQNNRGEDTQIQPRKLNPTYDNLNDPATHFGAQMKKVFGAFQQHPKTMLMVSIETGILRANLCRYVAVWRKENRIQVVRKGICPISKVGGVQFLTTNPELFIPIVEPCNTTER